MSSIDYKNRIMESDVDPIRVFCDSDHAPIFEMVLSINLRLFLFNLVENL